MAYRTIHSVAQSILDQLNDDDQLSSAIVQLIEEYDIMRRSARLSARYPNLVLDTWKSLYSIVMQHCNTNNVEDQRILYTLFAH
jgi:hypothetical protein